MKSLRILYLYAILKDRGDWKKFYDVTLIINFILFLFYIKYVIVI